ncbi:MAG: response regulator [Campylobacterota bacterium]|nr:response regulator [Campylobacterota bacterium]
MSSINNNKYNILCVDDNKNNLYTLDALLSTVDNINPIEALGAKEALNVLLTQAIDLILCDVQMPDINGFELAQMIKSNKKTKHIPIIFVTAIFKNEEFIKHGFEIGAIDYITKPIDDNQLLNKITLYLKIYEQKNKLAHSEKRFYDIAQSIGDGIYTLDLENKTTFINNEALNLLGFKKGELYGKLIHDYIHYKNVDNKPIFASECKVHKTMINGEVYKNENEVLIKKDGSFLDVSIVATPLFIDNNIVGSVTVFRDKTAHNKINILEHEKVKNQEQIILSMIDMIESRDSYTAGHTKRVSAYCVLIATEMGYSKEEIELLRDAAWLHDIGKISTPDSILLKPSKLDNTEYKLIQEHLSVGYEMLKKIDQYKVISEIMREHHEKFDGSGYPQGLKGDEIRPLSRIMIVADAFDAMTTNRVYKPRKSISVALSELQELSAIQFHPEVVSAAIVALRDVVVDTKISQDPKTVVEEQRFSYFYKDKLTKLFTLDYLELILRYYINKDDVYIYNIQLHNFSKYNKQFSWQKGDQFLIEFAKYLNSFYKNNIVFRVEGDDFMILSETKISDIKANINNYINNTKSIITCSIDEKLVKDIHSNIDKISI